MKTLTQKAVYAALAGASLTIASTAGAVNIDHDGLGEVLIYPYYTVRNGHTTFMSVVNTTTISKAVKVRINEGKNSAEVLDFNLFLSPKDVWTAAIVATADGAGIVTSDKSCTNPKVTGTVAFRNTAYATDNASLRSLDRTREGYIEIIEMATIDPLTDTDADVTHDSTGTPTCKLVSNAAVIANNSDYSPPTGGLFGNGTLVSTSMSTGYSATALEGVGIQTGVTASGTVRPNLNDATNTTAVVLDSPSSGTTRITAANFLAGIDAVSAVMMRSAVMGEYSYDSTFSTDWVITMPTKRFYVNGVTPALPFQRIWDGRSATGLGRACVDITINSYDREEGTSFTDDDFSPTGEAGVPVLCWESTVVSYDAAASTAPSSVVGSVNVSHYKAFQSAAAGGWAELAFGNVTSATPFIPTLGALPSSQQTSVTGGVIGTPTTGPVTFSGLPAIGFSIVSAKFPASSDNFNSSYNLAFRSGLQPTLFLNSVR
jgi:hypothetical protein